VLEGHNRLGRPQVGATHLVAVVVQRQDLEGGGGRRSARRSGARGRRGGARRRRGGARRRRGGARRRRGGARRRGRGGGGRGRRRSGRRDVTGFVRISWAVGEREPRGVARRAFLGAVVDDSVVRVVPVRAVGDDARLASTYRWPVRCRVREGDRACCS